jgi:hypothetical protein
LLPSQTQPESVPFLLVRAPVSATVDAAHVVDDDGETVEVPASRSVPPHLPPPAVVTTEQELPSVIVDLQDLEAGELADLQRASDVDVLLTASETIEFPIPEEPVELTVTHHSVRRRSRAGTAARVTLALVAALSAAGGAFAGVKVFHVSGGSLSAALHHVTMR